MITIIEAINQLELYLLEVEEKYIESHLGTIEAPNEYIFDVKSYCILCHAAFEECIENVCLRLLQEIVDNYVLHKNISYSTLCLLHFNSKAMELNDKQWKDNQRLFDHFTSELKRIKSAYSTYVKENNHGVDLKYLKKMLIPLGIDIPQNPLHQNSLSQLAKFRGGYAHTSSRAATTLSPEDAKNYVYDVYDMTIEIAAKARQIYYYGIY